MSVNRKSTVIQQPQQQQQKTQQENTDVDINNNSCSLDSLNSNQQQQQQIRKDSRLNDKFHQLFPTIPIYELVLQIFSCAYIKSINLYQGSLFLTSNYICFYSKIFSHETMFVLKWKDVTAIKKINHVFIFPTAIRIDTAHSSYAFTTFRSRTQTYDALIDVWSNALKKQIEISKAKPNDVLDYKLKLDKERAEEEEEVRRQQNSAGGSRRSSGESSSDHSQSSSTSSVSVSINQNNNYYCRANFDNSRNYFFYDLNFSQLSDKKTVIVSLRHKKSIIQKAKVLLGCLIPGFFNISRIDSLLPICFLMCILLLLNAFVLLQKVNQVDELFTQLLKPL